MPPGKKKGITTPAGTCSSTLVHASAFCSIVAVGMRRKDMVAVSYRRETSACTRHHNALHPLLQSHYNGWLWHSCQFVWLHMAVQCQSQNAALRRKLFLAEPMAFCKKTNAFPYKLDCRPKGSDKIFGHIVCVWNRTSIVSKQSHENHKKGMVLHKTIIMKEYRSILLSHKPCIGIHLYRS